MKTHLEFRPALMSSRLEMWVCKSTCPARCFPHIQQIPACFSCTWRSVPALSPVCQKELALAAHDPRSCLKDAGHPQHQHAFNLPQKCGGQTGPKLLLKMSPCTVCLRFFSMCRHAHSGHVKVAGFAMFCQQPYHPAAQNRFPLKLSRVELVSTWMGDFLGKTRLLLEEVLVRPAGGAVWVLMPQCSDGDTKSTVFRRRR